MITLLLLGLLGLAAAALARRLVAAPPDPRPICACGRPTWRRASDGWPECDHCLEQRLAARAPRGE